MTGTSAKVPAGTVIKAFVDEDVPLAIQAGAPPPLAIGSAPAIVPAAAQSTPIQATTVAPGVSVAKAGDKLE
jgi:hypothetical protein